MAEPKRPPIGPRGPGGPGGMNARINREKPKDLGKTISRLLKYSGNSHSNTIDSPVIGWINDSRLACRACPEKRLLWRFSNSVMFF